MVPAMLLPRLLFPCLVVLGLAAPAEANPLPGSVPQAAAESSSLQAVSVSLRPALRTFEMPEARWGSAAGRGEWTMTLIRAMRSHAAVLPEMVPQDIAAWCPAYPTASRVQREAFWVGLVSSLAWHESTHRPTAVGGGGLWYGLTQIYPDTARRYGCKARTGAALKDPVDNLSCAMRIMAVTVPRDEVVSRGMRGVAADWGPFHSRRKREDMRRWTRSQTYCSALGKSLRPVSRPATLEVPQILPMRPQSRPPQREARLALPGDGDLRALD